jgi:uncharacterized protein YyaL (SSP411 family)
MTETIQWMPWSDDAFARARDEDKPLLLSISAVWCHWCHVMDDTTYADGDVIARINASFVPVRVDNDERPDVNARYNMGGWPTTAFLAPDGTTLTGATYLPPAQMRRALDEIADFYRENKAEIVERAAEVRAMRVSYEPSNPSVLADAMVDGIVDALTSAYDEEYGGFGDAPKFPQPEALDMLLARWRMRDEPRLYEIVLRTMREMARGGMYDHVEGGFFRYSTTRDWSVPHFEKMSDDHAGLIRVLAQLQLWAPGSGLHDDLRSALGYVRTVLRDPDTGLFAGSQDADEAYYALPLEERRARKAPFIDRRSYSNWTSALAGAFAWAAVALDDDELAREALQALDTLHERGRDTDGLLFHVLAPGAAPRVRGLLVDAVAYIRGLLDTYEVTGEPRLLERALEHARLTRHALEAADGGFYDRVHAEALGRLDVPDRPLVENGTMAENLLRLHAMTGDDVWRDCAERTLTLYAKTYPRAGSFGATYARALMRYLTPPVTVRVSGDPGSASGFRETARRLPGAFTTVYAGDAPEVAAFVCVGTVCAAPVRSAADLRAAYDSVAAAAR